MVEQQPLQVQVELACTKCAKKVKVNVPVTCTIDANTEEQTLYCNVVGELEQYLPTCECGGALKPVGGDKAEPEEDDDEDAMDKRAYK